MTGDNGAYQFISVGEDHTITALFAQYTNSGYNSYVNKFTDVKESDWFYNNVRFAYTMGLMNGTTTTTFSPEEPTARAQFITVLWRMSGSPVVPGSGCQFNDVASGTYYYEAVRWGVANGIINGYSATVFDPNGQVTREQLVTMLFRYAKNYAGDDVAKYDTTNILGYSDVLQISKGAVPVGHRSQDHKRHERDHAHAAGHGDPCAGRGHPFALLQQLRSENPSKYVKPLSPGLRPGDFFSKKHSLSY